MSMNLKINKEELKKFVGKVQTSYGRGKGSFDGCWYCKLHDANDVGSRGENREKSDELYLVFACDEDEGEEEGKERGEGCGLVCKIAYNCDDLQCDYEWDWASPVTEDGDVISWDMIHCEDIEAGKLTEEVIEAAQWMWDRIAGR